MKLQKKTLNLEEGLKKEWIITNGIGGFASSTVLGANTRRYHGLLIAPLIPPAKRHLILSKVDESIILDGKKVDLYTNVGKQYIAKGYEYLIQFEKEYVPIFTYQIQDVVIKKYICMQYGKNTVGILYRIWNTNHQLTLQLTPLMNFRDFHSDSYGHEFTIEQTENKRKVKIILDKETSFPIYMNCSEGTYLPHQRDAFRNMFYMEEEKRGFQAEENHAIPGRYEIQIEPDSNFIEQDETQRQGTSLEDRMQEMPTKEISFVASLEENIDEINSKDMISKEIVRLSSLIYDSGLTIKRKKEMPESEEKELIKNYIIAADNFVVNRPSFGLHTLIAGYPWFLDWGRDSLIALEGLLLIPGRFQIAREVLLTSIRDVKYGLVPNGYSGYDNRPLYNSVDASLLLFEQIEKYLRYTNDSQFIKENFYEVFVKIIDSYIEGIDVDNNNIYLDEDGLLVSGTPNTQNTWMDVKIGNYAVTPRNGKAVEINSMWYNALKIMEKLTQEFVGKQEAKKYAQLATKCQEAFQNKFYNKRRKCLYDVLGDSKIRPNQLFSLSLTYPVLDPSSDIAKEMFETVTKKLLNHYGLKTLAKGEENYVEVYEGDAFRRDMSYHQGITWPWLLGIYYDAFRKLVQAEKGKTKRQELEKALEAFIEDVRTTFIREFKEGKTIGGIAELYDSQKPYESKGAFEQAWSVAEVFRIILEA